MQPDLIRRVLLAVALACPAAGQYVTLDRGRTLLQAAKVGDTAAALRLLKEPALVNLRDFRGLTALEWAASSGNLRLAEALTGEGARISSNAIELAKANGQAKLAQWLEAKLRPAPAALGRKEANSALFRAAERGNLKEIQKAVNAGAELDATDGAGRTAFQLAAQAGRSEAAMMLADRGAGARPAEMEPASNASLKETLTRIRSAAARIASTTGDPRLREAAGRAEKAVTRMSDRWAFAPPGGNTGSPEYTARINEVESLLAELAQRGGNSGSVAVMEAIAEDLETKLAHCIATKEPLGGVVRVRVHTRRAGSEVSNWRVFFAPKIFESMADKAADAFPRFSSPTEIEVVPGRYLLWARNPESNAMSERATVRIGGTKETMAIDLAVP